jgi:CheY-like chemotaxis protein
MSRVLLVEDELLIAMMMEDLLEDLGLIIGGVASTVEGALTFLRRAAFDAAVIDFKLADGNCFAVIAELKLRKIPFVLVTGSTINMADSRLAGVHVVLKPVDIDELAAVLKQLQIGVSDRCAPQDERSGTYVAVMASVDGR